MTRLRLWIAVALCAVVALGISSSPAYAYVNLRSSSTCSVAGTIWNITDLYHRDSTTGSVQSYGFNVNRQSGTGTLKTVRIKWEDVPGHLQEVAAYFYPYLTTDTGDQPFGSSVGWQSDQDIYFVLVSPSSAGDRTSTCLINVT